MVTKYQLLVKPPRLTYLVKCHSQLEHFPLFEAHLARLEASTTKPETEHKWRAEMDERAEVLAKTAMPALAQLVSDYKGQRQTAIAGSSGDEGGKSRETQVRPQVLLAAAVE